MTEADKIPATHPRFIEALNRFIVPAIQQMPRPEEKKQKGA